MVTQNLTVTAVPGSVDISSNTSEIRIVWTSTQTGSSWNGYTRTAKFYVYVRNTKTETDYSVNYTLPKESTTTIVDRTIRVAHDEYGEATVEVRTWMATDISAGIVEQTKTITLPTIPRAATIYSAPPRTLGEACSVTWLDALSTHFYKLNFSIGGWSHTTGIIKVENNGTFTYTGYTLPLEIAKQFPNLNYGKLKVTLATYSDEDGKVQVGSDSIDYTTVYIPDNANTQPTVNLSVSSENLSPSPYTGVYIQGHSRVKATLGITTKYDATVAASSVTVGGVSCTPSYVTNPPSYVSDILYQTGKVTVKATVKDSRGLYGTHYKEIDVLPYSKPYVRAKSGESMVIAARCDASANFTDSGTYLKIKAKVVYSDVGGNNNAIIKFRYRKEGGAYSDWQTILNCKTNNSDEVITAPLLNGALDVKYNYQVQIVATDDLYDSDPITIAISSDDVYMDRPAGGKSMALGGYSSGDGLLDIYWKTMARGGLSIIDSKGTEVPLGTTMPLARDQVATGWNPDALEESGVYVVAKSIGLKQGESVIMYNGVLIQMQGDTSGNVKVQLALPVDADRNPMYRICWYSSWSNWRSMKT